MEFCVEIIANGGIMATCIPLIKLINIQLFILCSYEPDLVLPCSLDSRVTLDWCLLQTRPPQRTVGYFAILLSSYTYKGHHGPLKICLCTPGWEPLA